MLGAKLYQRKKLPHESFEDYYYSITDLCDSAGIDNNEKIIKFLLRGLSPELATQISPKKPKTR